MHVVIPCANEDSVVRLKDEVITNIINDDGLVDLPSKQTQVFYKEWSILRCVLSVKSVFNVVADIDLVNDLVCIFLQSRSEDNDLVVFCHSLDELDAAWSHKEETIVLILDVVDQCLI